VLTHAIVREPPSQQLKPGLQEDGTVDAIYKGETTTTIRTTTETQDGWFMKRGKYKKEGKK